MGEPCRYYERLDVIASIKIDHPARLNAISFQTWRELSGLVVRANGEGAVRVIVLSGSGGEALSAGADISQFDARRSAAATIEEYETIVAQGSAALENSGKPTVALVRGICYGGGLMLALGYDLRVVREDARFCVPAARLGIGYATGNIALMIKKLGVGPTRDILMLARVVDADGALRLGIANRIWRQAGFEEGVATALRTIAGNAPLTLQAIRRGIAELMKADADRDLLAADLAVSQCFSSERYKEGQNAFSRETRPAIQRSLE
jgi:enoyl-CoA hydratase/carnithine racemase